jgi:hypothetical protein
MLPSQSTTVPNTSKTHALAVIIFADCARWPISVFEAEEEIQSFRGSGRLHEARGGCSNVEGGGHMKVK